MTIKIGDKIPAATLKVMTKDGPSNATTDELFGSGKVVMFSVPGAFTPTCSARHLPGFVDHAAEIAAKGVGRIVCVAVNDVFVMDAWGKSANVGDKIVMAADGNGEFTEKMGMLAGKEDLGFGRRSWRYSMLVRDGVIEEMFIEPDVPGDPYEVSDADTMLHHLAPNAPSPIDATVFTRKGCGHCVRAKQALEASGIPFEELILNRDFSDRTLRAITPRGTFPQVFINGQNIGGADDLEDWLRNRRAA